MFGSYDIPFKIEQAGISLSVEKEGEHLVYRRECLDEKVEKILLISSAKFLLNPVEPLNKPKELTQYLFIELEKVLVVGPQITKMIFLRFPIEIGVYVRFDSNFERVDIFSLMKPKFTLYGDPRTGMICKYWRSAVYSAIPPVDPIQEGVVELSITNTEADCVEMTKAVFNAYGMKIYYSDKMVSMKAKMRIKGRDIAETDFEDSPLEPGMKKALEIYTLSKLSMTDTKFLMELGL